jgi:hypothetical protein
MGTDPLRFPEVDYSSAQNDFSGAINAPTGASVPPLSELPHTLIEPSTLRAAKALAFE